MKNLRLQAKIDIEYIQAILRTWDPIGLFSAQAEERGPVNEYDSYAPQLVTLLRSGATAAKIQERLSEIRTKNMGLPESLKKDKLISEQLISWWESKKGG